MNHSNFESFSMEELLAEDLPTIIGGVDIENHIEIKEGEFRIDDEEGMASQK